MSHAHLLDQAKHRLEMLSLQRLKVADDFLAYLAERESDQATAELLAIPDFLDNLQEAERAIDAGKLTPAEELRRKP